MNIITVDDEQSALNILNRAVKEAVPDAVLHSFTDADSLIRDVRENGFIPDAAFLDIEIPGMNGIDLARLLKILHPKVNIVFVTGFSRYALDAYALRPSGYLTKPVTRDDVCLEILNLRNPPARQVPDKPVRIQCFGNFEVFVKGEPLRFLRSKCKELLAFLVDRRGGCCGAAEIADALWEDGIYDRSRQKQFSVIRADLIKSLKLAEAEYILAVNRDSLAVKPEEFDCDYYMMLAGDSVAINSFAGEYMSAYPWAEFTTAAITDKYSMA